MLGLIIPAGTIAGMTVSLVPVCSGHLPAHLKCWDEVVREALNDGEAVTLTDLRDALAVYAPAAAVNSCRWSILTDSDGEPEVVGFANWMFSSDRTAELCVVLQGEYRNRGIGAAAGKACLSYLFDFGPDGSEPKARRASVVVNNGNDMAFRLASRLGFSGWDVKAYSEDFHNVFSYVAYLDIGAWRQSKK